MTFSPEIIAVMLAIRFSFIFGWPNCAVRKNGI